MTNLSVFSGEFEGSGIRFGKQSDVDLNDLGDLSSFTNCELANMLERIAGMPSDKANFAYICERVGWSLPQPAYPPYWDCEHCHIQGGGIVPFSKKGLIYTLRCTGIPEETE